MADITVVCTTCGKRTELSHSNIREGEVVCITCEQERPISLQSSELVDLPYFSEDQWVLYYPLKKQKELLDFNDFIQYLYTNDMEEFIIQNITRQYEERT